MATAVLSFTTPGRVMFRCRALGIEGRRDLDPQPPFVAWSQRYGAAAGNPQTLLGIGLDIARWIDGPQQWLAQLIQATAPVILEIETDPHPGPLERAALEAPWELVARVDPTAGATGGAAAIAAAAALHPTRDISAAPPASDPSGHPGPLDLGRARHLALDPGLQLTCVRRLGPAAPPRPPSPYRLSVVFLAAQPDGLSGLAVEQEKVAIRRATGTLGVDLAVEDSGSLTRLGELVAQIGACDVLHLSCHGVSGDPPVLALAGEHGERVDATAADLSFGIGQIPPLVFLSACSSACGTGAEASDPLWSLSADLCRRGWPAVLGWSCSVTDPAAIELAAALYRQLALRLPLVEALARARLAFAHSPLGAEWHKPRLFLGPTGGGAIVDGTRPRPARGADLSNTLFAKSQEPA